MNDGKSLMGYYFAQKWLVERCQIKTAMIGFFYSVPFTAF
jgi:hypothetical protein